MEKYNEREILQATAAGDEAAFTILFRQYKNYIYSAAYKLLRHPVLAEEVVQDVFLKIWLKKEVLPDIECFPAFLYKVAENIIYPVLRKEATRSKNVALLLAESSILPHNADDCLAKEYTELLHQAVKQLPHKQQQTYILIKEEGLKRDQAAARLNVSLETVKSNLDQAMKRIRAYCLARTGALLLCMAANHCL